MIEELKAMLEEQRMRLRQLEKIAYTGLIAEELVSEVRNLCHYLEAAIGMAEHLETRKAIEAELHARFAQ